MSVVVAELSVVVDN